MPDVDLKEQINWLVKLQAVDSQIYSLQQEKQSIPTRLKELEEAFARKKENLAVLDKKRLDLLTQRKGKELELASKEEEARKMQTQLYQIKTNKEYSAKLKEIETVKTDASVLEDVILVLLEEADKLNGEINKEKHFLVEEEKKTNKDKQELDLRRKEIEGKMDQLQAQRKQFVQQLNPRILAKYDKILTNCDYLAIVKVESNACQGCFMKVSPQVINLIKMYDELVICEVCQRILYIEDEGVRDLH